MRQALRPAAAAAAILALGGCGQKGPLYLPEKGAAVVRPPAATPSTAPAASPPGAAPAAGEGSPAAPPEPKKPDDDSDAQSPQQ